mgnify:CR=1 FL=1
MDADEIRTLLGDNIFERAKKYRKRIQQSTCTVNADGVRHISAMVQGSGGSYYYTQAWLRENGSFVSASCSCRITRTARAPTASISAHCCWTMPKRMPCTGGKAGCYSRCCARRGGPCPGTGPAGQLCLRAGNAVWQKVARRNAGVGSRGPQAAGYLQGSSP